MEFNFNDYLTKGNEAAEKVINNRKEINNVMSEMRKSLIQFLEIELLLLEEAEYEDDILNENIRQGLSAFQPFNGMMKRQTTGFTKISLVSDNDKIKDKCYLFKLKRSGDGYPIVVAKNEIHLVADNQSEFASAIGEVLADAQTHIQLKQFVRKIKNILDK